MCVTRWPFLRSHLPPPAYHHVMPLYLYFFTGQFLALQFKAVQEEQEQNINIHQPSKSRSHCLSARPPTVVATSRLKKNARARRDTVYTADEKERK